MINRITLTAPTDIKKWQREIADNVNAAGSGYPFIELSGPPPIDSIKLSFTYYDTTLNKVRTFDGVQFNNHW